MSAQNNLQMQLNNCTILMLSQKNSHPSANYRHGGAFSRRIGRQIFEFLFQIFKHVSGVMWVAIIYRKYLKYERLYN